MGKKKNQYNRHEIYELFEKNQRKLTHGDRISQIRDDEKLTQAELAEAIGVDSQVVGYVERGVRLLPPKSALKLHLKYGYSLDWIYGLSAIPKESDKKFFVDIRKVVKIKGETVHISISGDLCDYLSHRSEIEESEHISARERDILIDELDKKDIFHASTINYCMEIPKAEMKHQSKEIPIYIP